MYVKKGVFRMLAVSFKDKRDLNFPNIPTMKEMGCPDASAPGYIVMGPRGMPEAVSKKLGETFKKVADEAAFQKVLASFDLSYEYKDRAQIEKEIPVEYERIKNFLKGMGAKKED
jgi:tripartite-type tricarboxylate transporter receptor subunit TctC